MFVTTQIRENLSRVRGEIAGAAQRAGRDPAAVRLIAVSKTFPAEAIAEAYQQGQREFGENRVQEFLQKRSSLDLQGIAFHLIGHLQTNKAAHATGFDWIQTIDSERLARKLNDAAAKANRILPVLIEVKLSTEETKTGASEWELAALASLIQSLPQLQLKGLMTVPPWDAEPEQARPYFRRLREMRDGLNNSGFAGITELSMGMSRDFQIAIQEGATMVRIGTAIFGTRGPRGRSSSL